MRRADRLFRIVEYLKARRQATTAARLAAELEVSVRTIYRDIADLAASGVPIIGEAGTGYLLDRHYTLRPLMFGIEELDALALGAQMVDSWGDRALGAAARSALDKIRGILPDARRDEILNTAIFSLPSRQRTDIRVDFTALRRAIRSRRRVSFAYRSLAGRASRRTVRPLALAFFGPVWLLASWCEMRQDFRNFRLDRMYDLAVDEHAFDDEAGRTLRDFLRADAARARVALDE